jgi:hypothetical protein
MFTAPSELPDDPAALQAILRAALAEIERLRLQIAGLQRHRFGRRSERLNEDALEQGAEDLEQSLAAQTAALEAVAAAPVSDPSPATPPQRNRGALPGHLPRIEVVVGVAAKACPCCGGTLHVIGEDRAEMLDYIPAQIRVKLTRRPRYGCLACEGAVHHNRPVLVRPRPGSSTGRVVSSGGEGHMRRPFYDFYVSTKSPLAAEVSARISAPHAIEADIRGRLAEHREQVRRARSRRCMS